MAKVENDGMLTTKHKALKTGSYLLSLYTPFYTLAMLATSLQQIFWTLKGCFLNWIDRRKESTLDKLKKKHFVDST